MSKQHLIAKEIIVKYHPKFKASSDLTHFALTSPELFNITSLVEEAMAKIGKYKFIDGEHMDFDDKSDCKTASIYPASGSAGSCSGEISGVVTSGGNYKAGALRVVVYNPVKSILDYFYIPRKHWVPLVSFHGTSNKGRVKFTYNKTRDEYLQLDKFKVKSFRQLALAN